ncbi:MAG: peptidylprolyl isomerase [bacterium]|nr:peptidylprolyl isomerase [bacterium]
MGAITKIRQISPLLLGVIAVLFIAFMVIQDSSCDSMTRTPQTADKMTAFKVNGDVVTVAEYEMRVQRTIAQQKLNDANAEIDDEAIRQQVYDMMVSELILQQEAEKLGIVLTADELREALLVNPPADIRQMFPDSANGFNRAIYEEVLLTPDKYIERLEAANLPREEMERRVRQIQLLPMDLEDRIRFAKLRDALSSTITAAATAVSPTYAAWNYTVENSIADVNFVAIDVKRVQDSEVSVSDADINEYYEIHKDAYEQKPSRRIKYMSFAAVPALKDTQNAYKRSTRVQENINAQSTPEKRDSVFSIELSQANGTEHDFMSPSKVDQNLLTVLQSLNEREVFGPLQTDAGITYIRLDGRRTDNPSIRASHILISMKPNKDSTKAEAEKILARIRKGEDFTLLAYQYSGDPGSKQKGGDLDYMSKNSPLVEPFKNALFADGNKVGDVLGPVETQFGYHLIKVTDIQTEEIKFSELTVKPIFSTTTRNHIRATAQQALKRVQDGETIDQVGKDLKIPVLETALFLRSEPILNSYDLTTWAFDSEKGAATRKDVKTMGTVVAQITDTRETGIKPIADVKDQITSILLPRKKLDKLKSLADQVASAIKSGGFGAINTMDTTLKMNMQQGVKNNGVLSGYGGEYLVTNKAFTSAINAIEGPIRGERAWFIVQTTNRTMADQTKLAAATNALTQSLATRMKDEAFGAWFQKVRDNADIVDERNKERQ